MTDHKLRGPQAHSLLPAGSRGQKPEVFCSWCGLGWVLLEAVGQPSPRSPASDGSRSITMDPAPSSQCPPTSLLSGQGTTLGSLWIIQDCPSQDPSSNPVYKVPFAKYRHIHRVQWLGHRRVTSGAIIQPSIWPRMRWAPRPAHQPSVSTWTLSWTLQCSWGRSGTPAIGVPAGTRLSSRPAVVSISAECPG